MSKAASQIVSFPYVATDAAVPPFNVKLIKTALRGRFWKFYLSASV